MIGPRQVLRRTEEFGEWYISLSATDQTRIDARLERLALGHWGDSQSLGGGLLELRWKNGMRIYYSRRKIAGIDVIVLWGGFKGTQNADIFKARRLKTNYENEFGDPS